MRILALAALIASADAAAEPAVRVAVLGDSLAAGYGLALEDAFPARLEAALRADGYAVEVLNAGVSGDTTAGGRARLDWTLADAPDAVIVELGANDGVRGIDPGRVFDNLDAIVGELKARGVAVLLAGMRAPPNYGRAYGEAFNSIYPRLADKHDVPLYPFFLEGVAARPEFNQPDGLHPNARGVEAIVERIAPYVKRLVESAAARGS
ncbi:MAG: arylesterase [Proteobacteria bacterium]|nr:arylesterase [Pseudomonadota bacterium]